MLCVLAVALVIAGMLYWNARQYISPSMAHLMRTEVGRTRTIVKEKHPYILVPPSESALRSAWDEMRTEMRCYGASDEEIEGVCLAADLARWYKGRLYALPVSVRPVWISTHKVWVFAYVWESGDVLEGRYSSHCMTCVFDATPPHELLSKEGCL